MNEMRSCNRCGKPAVDGLSVCEYHREAVNRWSKNRRLKLKKRKYQREYMRRYYAKRKAAGVCTSCGGERDDHAITCSKCRAYQKQFPSQAPKAQYANHRKRKAKLVAEGYCSRCIRRPLVKGHKLCSECLELGRQAGRQRRKDRMAIGLCTTCGKQDARPGREDCELCRMAHQKRETAKYRARVAAGSCRLCDSPPLDGGIYCRKHRRTKEKNKRYNEIYKARKRKGIRRCLHCGKYGDPGRLYCSDDCMRSACQ